MSGTRQPTDVIKARGRKHLSVSEEETRRDREVHVPPPDNVEPPPWFAKGSSKAAKALRKEYCEIGEILRAAGLFSALDRDVLAQYFLLRERWIAADAETAKAVKEAGKARKAVGKAGEQGAPDDGEERASAAVKLAKDWSSIQNNYFRQARACAEVMGLSVSSRCRLIIPAAVINAAKSGSDADDSADEFMAALAARQAHAGGG